MTEDHSLITLQAGTTTFDLIKIPPGDFMMGSSPTEKGHAPNEAPPRSIHISKAFYLGRTEITQQQYREVMKLSLIDIDNTLPIYQITYRNAIECCQRLCKILNAIIRLPTEAEWEYACRAGTQTLYCSGSSVEDLDKVGWYSGNSESKVHPVGQKQPNAWGIYDMHGNVWEFCSDFFEDYSTISKRNPLGKTSPNHGAMRGGGYMYGPEYCRSASRTISDDMFGGAGFRIAMTID